MSATLKIEADDVRKIKTMLLQSIQADHELTLVRENLAHPDAALWTVRSFNGIMRPGPVDIHAGEVAEMVMILDMLEELPCAHKPENAQSERAAA